MKYSITALVALASAATAHFTLSYPAVRGFDEDKLDQFPCGSIDTVSATRTPWPLTGGSIALEMGHSSSTIQVTIAFGNDPGSSFNTIIQRPISQTGLGSFCLTGITLPSGVNVTSGTNATIQVITNGDPSGGLYNCADITFSSTATGPSSDVCKNNTGATATLAASQRQPNETTSGSTTGGATPSPTARSDAVNVHMGVSGLVLAGLAGVFVAVL
ncbi:hypothetical protein HYFRA_00002556 [Hymenoscyphus fraxineus]|uniref:Copper acquisition factor BIM1-like domain-containing protein n=1 Tax=Hymenoscyphus fraxineus TaxID=746836 RepID=A0A9N9L6G3_9HELO|nr:hypothetical protein HYFRA_00002556 [Hymenoscyphus fraxineus]